MTNFEYYKDELLKIENESSVGVGLLNGKPKDCIKLDCDCCDIKGGNCSSGLIKWLFREYEPYVDWSKVEVDTPILVSNCGNEWKKRYFAKYENGKVYAFRNGVTSWTNHTAPVSWKNAKLKEVE